MAVKITTNMVNIKSDVPILFLVFNRPDTTQKVFDEIRNVQPSRLYIASDGARKNNEDDEINVRMVRHIVSKIDWECDVNTLQRKKNLGCKEAVSQAITWFFKYEEKGIILEDDCLPHRDFFRFCDIMLSRYQKNHRITAITGNNFQNGIKRGNASYYFSKYPHIWGWATWRRAWNLYDGNLSFWPEWKESKEWKNLIKDKYERKYREDVFDRVHSGELNSWGFAWTASQWYNGGLGITPNVNLVSNIGFDSNATHTTNKKNKSSKLPTYPLKEISHPNKITQNIKADRYTLFHHYGKYRKQSPYKYIYKIKEKMNSIILNS